MKQKNDCLIFHTSAFISFQLVFMMSMLLILIANHLGAFALAVLMQRWSKAQNGRNRCKFILHAFAVAAYIRGSGAARRRGAAGENPPEATFQRNRGQPDHAQAGVRCQSHAWRWSCAQGPQTGGIGHLLSRAVARDFFPSKHSMCLCDACRLTASSAF